MKHEMTLREMCDVLGVSRRAVQGYEEAGLVAHTGRNKYGHLLYDDAASRRVERIKFYQSLGFHIREIQGFIDAPAHVVKAALSKQIAHLRKEQQLTYALIEQAERLLRELH